MRKIFSPLLFNLCLVFIFTISCKKSESNEKPVQPDAVIDSTQTDTLSKIIINVSGMKNSKGNISIALYNSGSNFNDPEYAYRKYSVKAVSGTMKIILEAIPKGTYAFGLIHDENENNKMDKNGFSMPKEGFAFSNNAMGKFSPPTYNECTFYLPAKGTLTQIISLKFY